MIELAVADTAGIAARSVALTAFGLDSGIEIVTSLVVLRQLILQGRGAPEAVAILGDEYLAYLDLLDAAHAASEQ